MKFYSATIATLLLLFSTQTFASHTIEESMRYLRNRGKATRGEDIIVKIRDTFSGEESALIIERLIKKLGAMDLEVTSERLFVRGTRRYEMERLEVESTTKEELPHLENYFALYNRSCLPMEISEAYIKTVFETTGVEFAYFDTFAETAVMDEPTEELPEVAAETPDYESKQFHLKMAPDGVDAELAWKYPGGAGKDVKLIDSEWGWNQKHEDYFPAFWKGPNSDSYSDHGTAVWGEVAAKRDGKGVTGIAHESNFGTSYYKNAGSYDLAASQLSAGDILIIEQHQPGPDNGNYTAVEYWQANFDAFKSITARGIHIVEAAGNGGSNFDGSAYSGKFDLKVRDSGAILVGAAGAPNSKTPHERLGFSNYGSRIDVHAYGNNVVTTGYGNLFNSGTNRKYTATFSGTSSATPIVAGSVASLLGMLKAAAKHTTPAELREALRQTGTPQQGDLTKRIGNLPDLKQLRKYYGLDG